ncbi:FIVAR domain-containing protein [Mycoplasmoides gallisepticum]|uniref:FIVAR domain-containing protein n=1 Tax=Mycoplasmoides gallisepticum TaxID=2096 RepID=UPI001AD86A1B|nr:FIVAR domain-containing protein [Mycoplasmoides gallisepticum]
MKRKNILKFVSLLGIGSFVMLAAASCTSPVNPTPNPTPTPNPKPNPGGGNMNGGNTNPTSGGNMNGGNTNPGGRQGMMDSAAQELTAARTALTSLLASKNANVEMYSDYAKIKNDLTAAYTTAEQTSQNSSATLEQVKNATSTLQTAINTASNTKADFNRDNQELVEKFNSLKTLLGDKETTLAQSMDDHYATINNHLKGLYDDVQKVVDRSLSPIEGDEPNVEQLTSLSEKLVSASSEETINSQKEKADNLRSGFMKYVLDSQHLTGTDDQHKNPQPWNYAFAAYSVDLGGSPSSAEPTGAEPSSTPDINFSFAKRQLWSNTTTVLSDSSSLTDVSWIYGFFGADAKYTLTFDYFGPNNAYLYFPYKLVKQADSDKVELQYKLNDGAPIQVNFASSETIENTEMNPAPAVNKINVAKVMLTGLNNGTNKVEFSVPTTDNSNPKVAPMIGNIYLTSSPDNKNQIYNSIFGNEPTTDNPNVININLVTGYGLAADYSTYIAPYTRALTNVAGSPSVMRFLVDYVGNNNVRGPSNNNNSWYNNGTNPQKTPSTSNDQRSFIFYVNAPQDGDYSIQGTYYTGESRGLNFALDGSSDQVIKISNLLSSRSWNGTLRRFDTNGVNATNGLESNRQSLNDQLRFSKTSLHLTKGLNKIIVTGDSTIRNKSAALFGELTFTLMSNNASNNRE